VSVWKWGIRLAGVAIAVFLILVATNFRTLYERVRLDRAYPALSRYEFERTPSIAIVGSSMSFTRDIFEHRCETYQSAAAHQQQA